MDGMVGGKNSTPQEMLWRTERTGADFRGKRIVSRAEGTYPNVIFHFHPPCSGKRNQARKSTWFKRPVNVKSRKISLDSQKRGTPDCCKLNTCFTGLWWVGFICSTSIGSQNRAESETTSLRKRNLKSQVSAISHISYSRNKMTLYPTNLKFAYCSIFNHSMAYSNFSGPLGL